jgi:hypothetical protein
MSSAAGPHQTYASAIASHWSTDASADALGRINRSSATAGRGKNVTHLYHEVVWQHLRRFRQQTDMAQEPSVHTDGSGKSLAITMRDPDCPDHAADSNT